MADVVRFPVELVSDRGFVPFDDEVCCEIVILPSVRVEYVGKIQSEIPPFLRPEPWCDKTAAMLDNSLPGLWHDDEGAA